MDCPKAQRGAARHGLFDGGMIDFSHPNMDLPGASIMALKQSSISLVSHKMKMRDHDYIFLITSCLDVPWNSSNSSKYPDTLLLFPVGGVDRGPVLGAKKFLSQPCH